jgi:hypothetical protein
LILGNFVYMEGTVSYQIIKGDTTNIEQSKPPNKFINSPPILSSINPIIFIISSIVIIYGLCLIYGLYYSFYG